MTLKLPTNMWFDVHELLPGRSCNNNTFIVRAINDNEDVYWLMAQYISNQWAVFDEEWSELVITHWMIPAEPGEE